jgi:PAS domain S-box-containing protein
MTAKTASPLQALLSLDVQTLLDSIPVAIFIKDAHSRILLVNRACEEQWGISREDAKGSDGSPFLPPELVAYLKAQDQEVFERGEAIEFQEELWNPLLREARIGHTCKRPVFDASGRPRYLIGVTLDITERVRAEMHQRGIDEKLRHLYEMSPVGIVLTDLNGRYLDFNQAFQRICGYSV